VILTVDFGTTITKVGVWGDGGLVALARSEVATSHPKVGFMEQDPLRWWTTVVIACAEVRAQAPAAFGQVEVVAFSGARQTFVPATWQGDPIGKGILWSDRRAAAEARLLAERMGGDDINRARTGIPLDAGAVAAKLAWLAEYEPERLEAADVILSPRDLIVYRMTAQVVTDATFASRSGLYDFDGNVVIMDVYTTGDGLSLWDIRIFENVGESQYLLHHEQIGEMAVSLSTIRSALETKFALLEEMNQDGDPPTDDSVKAHFAYRRR